MKQIIYCLAAALVLFASAAQAHEFIIKPAMIHHPDQKHVGFSVVSSHVFMASEDMEPLSYVQVSVVGENTPVPVELKENPMLMSLDGQAPLSPDKGYTVIFGHRKPMVWSQTAKGWIEGGKKGDKGVLSSKKYEKFCKTLVWSGKGTEGFDQKVGCPLEIVPKTCPAQVKPGTEMALEVLFEGKPLKAKIWATYDRFSSRPNTWAYCSQSDDSGRAGVKISSPGIWMVRVEKEIQDASGEYDSHSMRSMLVFEVF